MDGRKGGGQVFPLPGHAWGSAGLHCQEMGLAAWGDKRGTACPPALDKVARCLYSAGRLWRKDDTARWGCGGTAFLIAGGKTNALASLCSPRHSRMGIRVGSGRCHGLVGVGNGRVAVEGNDEKIGACQRVLSTIICRGKPYVELHIKFIVVSKLLC